MQFLICVGGEKYSADTLSFGVSLAASLKADVSVLYVRQRLSYFFKEEARLARLKVEQWEMETAEARVIAGVQELLLKAGFLRTVDGKVDVRHTLKPGIRGAWEYHLYGVDGENVRIRVREGDVVESIIRETTEIPYDLVLVGAPRDGGRLVRQIIQYVDSSVLIVKNPRLFPFRLLLCLDNSDAARKAQDFSIRTARLLQTSIDVLCIYSLPWEEHQVIEAAERAQKLLKRFEVPHTVRLRRGPVVGTILREVEPDHIVVMGHTRRSSLSQLFFDSTPVKIGRQGKNSVLVVK